MNNQIIKKVSIVRLLPLFGIELFWIVSYLFYRYGIVKYPFGKDNLTGLFLLSCHFLFFVGYIAAIFLRKGTGVDEVKKKGGEKKLLIICCIISILVLVPNSLRYTGNWYPPIVKALANPGAMYMERVTDTTVLNSVNWIAFFDVFILCVFPITFLCWNSIGKFLRISGTIIFLMYLSIFISCGRNMPVFFSFVSVLVSYAVILCSKSSRKDKIRSTGICIGMITIMVIMFGWNLASRTHYDISVEEKLEKQEGLNDSNEIVGSLEKNESGKEEVKDDKKKNIYVQYKDLVVYKEQVDEYEKIREIFPMYANEFTKAYANVEHGLFKVLPDRLKFYVVMLNSYLNEGYHTLSVELRMEHQWTYGLGSSAFLMDYFNRFTGINLNERTYWSRSKELTDPPIVSAYGWPSAYAQLADDFTFPGVVVLMGIIGFATCSMWMDAVEKNNLFASLAVIQMGIFLFFMAANCITLNSGGYFVTFITCVGSWILYKVFGLKKRCHR